jgi:glutathione synthase
MSLHVAIQMDRIETVDINADSTFALALEAQRRGYRLSYYLPTDLSFREGRVVAMARTLEVQRVAGDFFTVGARTKLDLRDTDVVLMRQDPPFDMGYITATHLLEHVTGDTLVVNDPVEVRNAPEKMFVTHFPDLMPETLITHNPDEVADFRARHKDIIVKPLYGNGGAGVFHIKPDDENLNSLVEMFLENYREPMIVQRYLPEVRAGDKRIILVDGEPAGGVSRIPQAGEARSNFHAGGLAQATELTAREREICAAIGPTLREKGLVFVGIDVIGDYLTEINVTSPTGIQEIDRLSGTDIASLLWDAIDRRCAERAN